MQNESTDKPEKKLLLMPAVPEAEAEAVEESVGNTALTFSGPLTRDTLAEYSESQLIRNAKRIIPRTFRALAKLVDQGDKKAIEMALQTYSYVGKGAGVTIVNNVLQQNAYGGAASADRAQEVYFEKIVRGMDQEDQAKNADIIDAEVVD